MCIRDSRRAITGQPLRFTAPPADREDPELARIATVCSRRSIQPIRYSNLRSMPPSVREYYEGQIERWGPIAAQRTSTSSTAEPESEVIVQAKAIVVAGLLSIEILDGRLPTLAAFSKSELDSLGVAQEMVQLVSALQGLVENQHASMVLQMYKEVKLIPNGESLAQQYLAKRDFRNGPILERLRLLSLIHISEPTRPY